MQKLTLDLGVDSYNILVGKGLIANAGGYIKEVISCTPSKVFVIVDKNLLPYVDQLETSLKSSFVGQERQIYIIMVNPGESSKSFANLEWLVEEILQYQPDRNSLLVAFGGGVVGDLTGFVASILLRGVRFVQIPTTLLAQVDSSVGGKTAINSRSGKNLVGSFYQPELVIADIDLLTSLSDRDYLSGYAEVVKYGLINDAEFFAFLDQNKERILARDIEILSEMVVRSCRSKADIVAQDEKEKGVRALLNLGHSFGHSLEKETDFRYDLLTHGESVAIGMNMAFCFSEFLGLVESKEVEIVGYHLKAMGLPVHPNDIKERWDIDNMVNNFYGDKKVRNGKLIFILVKGIGKSFICEGVEEGDLRVFLEKFL